MLSAKGFELLIVSESSDVEDVSEYIPLAGKPYENAQPLLRMKLIRTQMSC